MEDSNDAVSLDMETIYLGGKEHHIRTGRGTVSVIVYGDQEKPALITYPDLALNHMSCFQGLFFCPEAASLLLHNFCIYHISPPGHELGAASIRPDEPVPSVDDLADQVIEVLNYFGLGAVMCMGVTAGAYILTLFALKYRERVLGLILVSPLCKAPSWGGVTFNLRRAHGAMKIVTYNVNGLRPRISQFGSLLKFLSSLDADIICVQETKLSRHELTADVVMADGYESFFSCTRTNSKGRVGYSGVATFCRVKSAFSSTEVALPIAAEEGFTGLLEKSGGFGTGKDEIPVKAEGLEEFAKDDLLKVDSEGRCIITDHGHFVLFNIYGPRADSEDTERIQFKHTFFQILQKRWETLQQQGRRIFVVGDLNIAPAAIDRCDAGPDFEKNEFRRWFRSMLVECGGPFFDVFRAKHPDRREAYTCWSSSTGAEEFNYGSRIDHILSSGSCLHQDHCLQDRIFVTCHVKECDILTQFKRWKPGNKPRWKGGRSIKLEGSDHAPVFMSLMDIPDVAQHSTPSLSARYVPTVHGFQQTIASVLMKRQKAEQVKTFEVSSSFSDENITTRSCSEILKRSSQDCCISDLPSGDFLSSSNLQSEGVIPRLDGPSICSISDSSNRIMTASIIRQTKSTPGTVTKKKARQSQCSQLSLKSFFQKSSNVKDGVDNAAADASLDQADESKSNQNPNKTSMGDDESKSSKMVELDVSASNQEQGVVISGSSPQRDKNDIALVEWQRIQQLMQNSIPLCKGHGEPCVSRVAKKPGPNHGRRFYVCARAEGPASNPETNCGYFKWAASKSRHS